MAHGGRKMKLPQQDDHLDLVPLIDCVFLLLLFFMLCGRMSTDQRTEQITVPPTKTAAKFDGGKEWQREVINIFGSTQNGDPPRNALRMGAQTWYAKGLDDYSAYQRLRQIMDTIYDRADKYDDPKGTGIKLPKVIVELRADSETEYRVVQEVQQVLTDALDLTTMKPKQNIDKATMKAFVNIDFTTRKSNEDR